MHLWVEPAGGEQKSADVERKTVTLIYPYPKSFTLEKEKNVFKSHLIKSNLRTLGKT
jgi:hypothetical protein